MSEIIKRFYEDKSIPSILLKQKLSKFEENEDIASEFEYWIEKRTYKVEGAIDVEGYTAKSLADSSQYLDGEGAFMMLIELRRNPNKAMCQIEKGFKRK